MNMTVKQHVDHWVDSSSSSLIDMGVLIKSKRFDMALYCGHLALEKILKALLAVRDSKIAWSHDLRKLVADCRFTLTPEQQSELRVINQFNVEAKYSSVKSDFRTICTPAYAKNWSTVIRKWHGTFRRQVLYERASVPNNKLASHTENIT